MVNENGWPASTVDGETVTTGREESGPTVTVTVAVVVPPIESVTRTQ
jgi:hypothetical protein